MKFFVSNFKNDILSIEDDIFIKTTGEYFDNYEDAEKYITDRRISALEKEIFFDNQKAEENMINDFFKRAPNKTEEETISLMAELAVDLFERSKI